ncbi:MAG TPA: hypothetical protein GX505_10565 [Clostridiales bacterium]|nr:hypothetical protein [Clostridiales bacterium]
MVYLKDRESVRKVLVIGDIMLDQYVIGKASRLCPEAPAPVLEADEINCFPGGAANVAVNIKNIGGQVTLAGVIGKDEEGEILRKALKQKDISAVLGVDPTRPTTVKKRIGTREQLVVRLDRELVKDIPHGIFHDILQLVTVLLDDVNLVTISDYGKGVVTRELFAAVGERCKSRNIPVFVDPKGADFTKYRGAELIKPNLQSMEAIYGNEIHNIHELESAADLVFSSTLCKACIMTWGANGVVLFRSPKDWIHYPCPIVWQTPFISGAGDVFMAGLSMAACQGLPIEIACMMANDLAASTVGRIGTVTADAATWKELLAKYSAC